MRKSVRVSCIAAVAAFCWGASGLSADQLWSVHGGKTVILLDNSTLSELGLRVESTDSENFPAPEGQVIVPVTFDTDEMVLSGYETDSPHFTNGQLHNRDGIVLSGPAGRVVVQDLAISAAQGHKARGPSAQLITTSTLCTFDKSNARLAVQCDAVVISRALATALGAPAAAGRSIGGMQTNADMVYMGGDPLPANDDQAAPHICASPVNGPDVIVGDMPSIANYTPPAGSTIDCFSVATTSCNMGNVDLLWQSGNSNHPVIPQHMYRMKTVNGSVRFEQIGLSWMKHGFTALTGSVCCTCTNPGTGALLGRGCSDPYSDTRNGTQIVGSTSGGGCGPRFQTNPHTGAFTYPYMFKSIGTISGTSDPNSLSRRLQVANADLDPTLNAGATYYVETQYVTPDDAAAKNQNNNCSYRPCTISVVTAGSNFSATVSGSTTRQKSAIQAWKASDASVTETIIDTPEDTTVVNSTGRGILAAKATSLGGGMWHYEYALYNMNSDRGFASCTVPVGSTLTVSNIGFHDVSFHSGDGVGTAQGALVNVDGTDWPSTRVGCSLGWAAVPLVAPANPLNTNYIHWGTTYNFRFDCNAAPTTGNMAIGFFKAVTGQPNSMQVSTVVPCSPPIIDPIPAQGGACGQAFISSAPSVCTTSAVTWSITAGAEPGMVINPSSGVVSWPNAVASASTYNVTLQAAHACSAALDTKVMAINVPFAADPVIDPIAPQNATCGVAFTSSTPTGTGLSGATWAITLGGQPGMTINSSGVVSWPNPVPNAAPYNVTIQATNPCAAVTSDTEVMSISVPFAADPVIDPIAPQNATCGTPFTSATPTGTGLAGATWAITLGGQPGMTIDSSGVISWPFPLVTGSPFNVTIQASNACSANAGTTVVTINVTSGGGAIAIDPMAADATVCGVPFTSAIPTASGGTPPYNWSLSGQPVGMTINPTTGQISWPVPVISPTPYNITIGAGDNCTGTPATTSFSLTVRLGDFDGDGLVNVGDVPGFIDHLLGVSSASSCAGDMNGDTFLDGLDVQGFVGAL